MAMRNSDKIIIKNLRAYGIIGIYPMERQNPQEILINVIIFSDISPASKSDNIADCLDYDMLAKKIKTYAETSARYTVEALANDLANICLQENKAKMVRIRVEKPTAVSFAESVGIEVFRRRK